jgi:membrane-associated phospholipid phosphatase
MRRNKTFTPLCSKIGMRSRIGQLGKSILPHGWFDVVRQLSFFLAAYMGYQLVRGLVSTSGYKPAGDATRVINFERSLHVFAEPAIQHWVTSHLHWVMDIADWTYLDAHMMLTAAVLVFIYLRRNESFYFVRNTFMIAMALALVGYTVFPTAPPRLMPQWGFTDSIQQFTHVTAEQGATGSLINSYAAIPSMHVCFAVMVAFPMARLVEHRVFRYLWYMYPIYIAFVVVVTGNHYFTDVFLGALTAGVSALLAKYLLARARPDIWTFTGVNGFRPRIPATGSARTGSAREALTA